MTRAPGYEAAKRDNAKGVGAAQTVQRNRCRGACVLCLVARPTSRVTVAAIGLAGHCDRVSREQRRAIRRAVACDATMRCKRVPFATLSWDLTSTNANARVCGKIPRVRGIKLFLNQSKYLSSEARRYVRKIALLMCNAIQFANTW